ncbi:hypothetical protein EMCRGX_G008690 [Ephydatia muelleri]
METSMKAIFAVCVGIAILGIANARAVEDEGAVESYYEEKAIHGQQGGFTTEETVAQAICHSAVLEEKGYSPFWTYAGFSSHTYLDMRMHSFDYCQQGSLPYSSQQRGTFYFRTPHKVQVFGVCCELLSSQVFFLVDESEQVGKGAVVVSLVYASRTRREACNASG